jgi:hypothetical protein
MRSSQTNILLYYKAVINISLTHYSSQYKKNILTCYNSLNYKCYPNERYLFSYDVTYNSPLRLTWGHIKEYLSTPVSYRTILQHLTYSTHISLCISSFARLSLLRASILRCDAI